MDDTTSRQESPVGMDTIFALVQRKEYSAAKNVKGGPSLGISDNDIIRDPIEKLALYSEFIFNVTPRLIKDICDTTEEKIPPEIRSMFVYEFNKKSNEEQSLKRKSTEIVGEYTIKLPKTDRDILECMRKRKKFHF